MVTPVADAQDRASLSPKTGRRERSESRSIETNEPPPVKRLDGEVTRQGDFAFSEGNYCEVWIGLWENPGNQELGREKVIADKSARVSPFLSY